MLPEDTTATRIGLQPPSADDWISPDRLQRNSANPRLIFRQKELDALKRSIFEVGILQPLIVYELKESPGTYVLIDGERRWRCARELNLQKVPVHIHKEPTEVQNLTMMFNIHKLRVDWELMPTALSLKKLMDLTREDRVGELSRMTGLSQSMVRKCFQLLSFSTRHQDLALGHKIKDNLLLETYPVLRSLEKHLPDLLEERGRDSIVDSIINKERTGNLKSVIELRNLARVVEATSHGAPKPAIRRIVTKVLDEPQFSVETAYSRVRSLYDVQHLTDQFSRLADEIATFDPTDVDVHSLKALVQSLGQLKKQLGRLEARLSAATQMSRSGKQA
jgi:ParB family chromosome partitioning protein